MITALQPSLTALLVIDVQQDFCTGGALAVEQGDEVVPVINRLLPYFSTVVLTQDWHPQKHQSFASNHPRKSPFEVTELAYGKQVLWPDHCVQGTAGAAFHPELVTNPAALVVRKGMNPDIDSYSAFVEADRETTTGLAGWLHAKGITEVICTGLATDFCVGWSALDAQAAGFATSLYLPACRAIDMAGSLSAMLTQCREADITIVD